MKKPLIVSALCLINFAALAQTVKYEVIDYPKTESYTTSKKETIGSRYGLKITNINKKLVTVNQNVTQTSYHETQPSLFELFSKTKLPQAAEGQSGAAKNKTPLLATSAITAAKISEKTRSSLVALNLLHQKTQQTIEDNEETLTTFIDHYRQVRDILTYQSNLMILQDNCELPFSDIRKKVNELTLKSFENAMGQPDNVELNKLDYELNKQLLNNYFIKVYSDGEKIYEKLSSAFVASKSEQLAKDVATFKTKLAEAIALLEKEKGTGADAILASLKNERDSEKLSMLLLDHTDRTTHVDIHKLHADLQAFDATGRKEVFSVYNYFTESNWTYIVDPQPIDKDLTVISVNIKPKDGIPCSLIERSYSISVKAKSGIKIDFSTGLFANFGGNDFRDQSYGYEEVEGNTTQQKIIRNDNKNTFFPSVGALMHIYRRTGNEVNVGGVFGLSTKDLEKINYHLGASVMFGTSNRFIISSGMTLTKATLIADKYKVGQLIDKAGAPEQIPTASFDRLGFFVAFTYNLSSK